MIAGGFTPMSRLRGRRQGRANREVAALIPLRIFWCRNQAQNGARSSRLASARRLTWRPRLVSSKAGGAERRQRKWLGSVHAPDPSHCYIASAPPIFKPNRLFFIDFRMGAFTMKAKFA